MAKVIDRLDESTPENDHQLKESFDEFLNEVLETVTIGEYHYDPARVLQEIDPVAYDEEFNCWIDQFHDDDESFPGGRWMCGECRECHEFREEAEECC